MTTAVAKLGLLFMSEMARSLFHDQKTEARRLVKRQPPSIEAVRFLSGSDYGWLNCADQGRPQWFRVVGPVWAVRQLGYPLELKCPYGAVGDRLYVKETWQDLGGHIVFRADYLADPHGPDGELSPEGKYRKWRSSLLLPRRYSRGTIELTNVRLEPVQAITEAEAVREGMVEVSRGVFDGGGPAMGPTARNAFMRLWASLHGGDGASLFDASGRAPDPWVWVLTFRKIKPCPHDTDGDGDCHLCVRRPSFCPANQT